MPSHGLNIWHIVTARPQGNLIFVLILALLYKTYPFISIALTSFIVGAVVYLLVNNRFQTSTRSLTHLTKMPKPQIHETELALLYNACINDFNSVAFSKGTSSAYEKSMIGLQVLQVRYTRWGESVKINRPNEFRMDTGSNNLHHLLEDLGQVFLQAKNSSQNSKPRPEETDAPTCLTPSQRRLYAKLKEVATSRAGDPMENTSLSQEAHWALSTERQLGHLIIDLSRTITRLEQASSTSETRDTHVAARAQLCQQEILQLSGDSEALVDLKDVVKEDSLDSLLEGFISQKTSGGNVYQRVETQEEARLHNGSNGIATSNQRFLDIIAGVKSQMQNGDNIGGSSFWSAK